MTILYVGTGLLILGVLVIAFLWCIGPTPAELEYWNDDPEEIAKVWPIVEKTNEQT